MKQHFQILSIKLLSLKEKIKLVWYYFQGMSRSYLLHNYPKYVRKHIQEQYRFRLQTMRPKCLIEHQCEECGCKVPELQMASKSCDGNCYPPFMSKEKWTTFLFFGSKHKV